MKNIFSFRVAASADGQLKVELKGSQGQQSTVLVSFSTTTTTPVATTTATATQPHVKQTHKHERNQRVKPEDDQSGKTPEEGGEGG